MSSSDATTAAPSAEPPASPAQSGTPQTPQSLIGMFRRWETALLVILIAVIIFGAVESSDFLTTTSIFFGGLDVGQVAIMALPLTLIVITGEIDLSVAAMLGLSASVFGYAFEHGTGTALAIVIALAVGALGGSLNGFLITRLGLPSIAVTIGTLTMFRGIAEVLLGSNEVTGYPTGLTVIGDKPVFAHIAYPFLFFIILAIIYAVVLHKTPVGRSLYAIGLNKEAAFFSGIRVNRTKLILYVLSGVVCAFAGIVYAFQNDSSIYTAGTGLELNVVAVVLFGGVSIFGGKGSLLGVVLSVLIVAASQVAFTLINISAEEQQIIFGVLLLFSVLVPNSATLYRQARSRIRQARRAAPSAGATT
jgi:rhamnose transport system permease protein